MWIEARKLFELQRCAAHHEAVPIICVSLRRGGSSQGSVSFVVFEHGLISKRERVPVKTECGRCVPGVRHCDGGKNTEPENPH